MTRLATQQVRTDSEIARAQEALETLARIWRAAATPLPAGIPNLEAAGVRLESGVPALAGEPLVDGPTLVSIVREIGGGLGRIEGYESASHVSAAVARGLSARGVSELDRDLLALAALTGTWNAIEGLAVRLGVDGHALVTLLDYAARPALRAGASAVRPLVAKARWNRGTCPACGAPATLSVRSGKEGERSLFCGRCGTGWQFPRVRCPACGEADHRRLDALHLSGEGDFRRAEVCESCRCYVKTVAALSLPDADGVLRLDLDTAALDFGAMDQGYHRAGTAPPSP